MKRKNTSRVIAVFLMACMILVLSACGNGGNKEESSVGPTQGGGETEVESISEEAGDGIVADTSESTSEETTTLETTTAPTTTAPTTTAAPSETTAASQISGLESAAVYVGGMDGEFYYADNADSSQIPASTVKLMTALIAIERCSMDEIVTYSANSIGFTPDVSVIGAVEGEQMSMEDCLYGLLLPSGCDCANAIAEHVSGSISAFCELMTQYAADLGCTDTYFANPSGVDDWANYTTARDMYIIARAALSNDTLRKIASTRSYTIPQTNMSDARNLTNTNYNIMPTSGYFDYRVVAGKTGMTTTNTRCLVVLANDDGREMIIVLFACPSLNGVFSDVTTILNQL